MGASCPKVSVIIATYRREAVLCDAIRCVLADPWPNKEVLVVDQTPRHEPETQRYLESVAGDIRLIRTGPPSVTGAENRGIQEATGDILLFLDDDVTFEPGLLAAHVRNYADPSIIGVGGLVLDVGCSPVHRLPGICYHARFGYIFFRHDYTGRVFVPNAMECNMSIRRQTLLNVGPIDSGFTENAVFWGMDLCYRVVASGGRMVHDPEARVLHLRYTSGGARMKLLRPQSFFDNLFRFLNKHANRHERFSMALRLYFYRVLVDGWREPWVIPRNTLRFLRAWWSAPRR